jgi:hypothetical protein
MPLPLLLSLFVTAALAQAPPVTAARNLLNNPGGDHSLAGWLASDAVRVERCDGDPCFVLKNQGQLQQFVELPADSSGRFLVIIGSGRTERIHPSAITGLPYLYGSVLNGPRITAYFQGQQMRARPANTDEWVPMFGIFQLPADGGMLSIQASLAEARGVPQNGSAARFDDLGCYVFATAEEAQAFVAAWSGTRSTMANRKVDLPPAIQQASLQTVRRRLTEKLQSQDVAWLEAAAGDDTTAERDTPAPASVGETRRRAYVRLGQIGTSEALAALDSIRTNARSWTMTPAVVPLGTWPHAAPHVSASRPQPIATVDAPDGTTYGLLVAGLLGDTDLFLVSRRPGAEWSRPLLVPGRFYPGVEAPILRWTGPGALTFSFTQRERPAPASVMSPLLSNPPQPPSYGPQVRTVDIGAVTLDSDRDGWTDLEEERLTLDPQNPDSDDDGMRDGVDASPNHSARGDREDDETVVVREALFATFGINRSRSLIHVEPAPRPVQLWGFRGPVIYGVDTARWRETHDLGYVQVSWQLVSLSQDAAVVQLRDYEARLSAASYRVRLARIGTTWVIVEHTLTAIA